MKSLINFIWRQGLRLAYPLARCYWSVFRRDIEGTYIFLWHAGRILLIRNSYRRAHTAPGGMVARGEDPRFTAARELKEEVGITVSADDLRYLGEAPKKKPENVGKAHMFEICLDEQPAIHIDQREVIWAGFLAPAEARDRDLDFALRIYLRERQD